MNQSYLSEPSLLSQALEAERQRLVRLCISWLGDPAAAEDVVQETMVEAWRKIDTLRDPGAFQSWLSGIARNMSLRWLRRRGRDLAALAPAESAPIDFANIPSSFDFEVELDRADLTRLLEQALSLLPEDTRTILVQKYVDEASQKAIAAELGLSENVVAVRLHRGKLALRKVLESEFQRESSAFGLLTADDNWQQTRIWCTGCGQRQLLGRLDENEFILRCPDCNSEPESFHSQSAGGELSAVYKTFRPTLKHFSAMMDDLFQTAIRDGAFPCRECGAPMPLRLSVAHYAPPSVQQMRGLHMYCTDCASGSYETLDGLALNLPQGRAFFQAHPRIHSLPQREIERDGLPAVVVSFAAVGENATFDVILKRNTYEALGVHSSDD